MRPFKRHTHVNAGRVKKYDVFHRVKRHDALVNQTDGGNAEKAGFDLNVNVNIADDRNKNGIEKALIFSNIGCNNQNKGGTMFSGVFFAFPIKDNDKNIYQNIDCNNTNQGGSSNNGVFFNGKKITTMQNSAKINNDEHDLDEKIKEITNKLISLREKFKKEKN